MVDYAKEKNVARVVQTTTNGSLICDRFDELIKITLDMIRISVEHLCEENHYRITGTRGSFQNVSEGIKLLYEEKVKT